MSVKSTTDAEAFKLQIDSSELLAAIDELSQFVQAISQLPPSLADRLVGFIHAPSEIARIESKTAEGACRILTLKPSDGFNDLLAALRANNLKARVVGDNVSHGESVSV